MLSLNDPQFSTLLNSKRENYLHWNDYFMAIAVLSSYRSKDPLTQVGAVLVNEDNRIIGIGYNGFPRNCDDDKFPWYKYENVNAHDPIHDKKLFVVHAEANAILNSNTINLKSASMYTTLFPCNECAKLILQCGIRRVFYICDKYKNKTEFRAARLMFESGNVECCAYQPIQRQILLNLKNF